jgi:hypothetical protein
LEFYRGAIELRAFRIEKVNINQTLKARGLSEECHAEPMKEQLEIDRIIGRLVEEQKVLPGYLTKKRKALAEAKSALSKTNAKKGKIELPRVASIEALFADYTNTIVGNSMGMIAEKY